MQYIKIKGVTKVNHKLRRRNFFNQQITDTFNRLKEIFPAEATEEHRNQLLNIAETAYRLANEVFSVKETNIWAADFKITDDIVNSDEALFRASMRDMAAMARMRKQKLSQNRLNRSRIESSTRHDNPERDRLFCLADTVMPLLLRPGFIPNGAGPHPTLRRKYASVISAVNRLLFENFHQKGSAFILTKETAATIPGLHLSPPSWTEKQGKDLGHPIGGCSDGGHELNNEPLNSDHTKIVSDELWGQMKHPTLKDICLLIDNFCIAEAKADSALNDKDIVLIKLDLQQAFTLVDFEASDVKHLAMEMTDNKVIFFLCGLFGWSGTPAAFNVYTRAIIHELIHRIRGKGLMYVDDITIVTRKSNVNYDIDVTNKVCCSLLGYNAVGHKKTEFGRKILAIVSEFDLDKGLRTLNLFSSCLQLTNEYEYYHQPTRWLRCLVR
jgi:hypothetical protein